MRQLSTTIDQATAQMTQQDEVTCRPAMLAVSVDLVYMSDSEPGFQRRRAGCGLISWTRTDSPPAP